ncbi:MAG: hypothetical protein CL610_24695 [Anaerolineaceae bacterium]|nr:hypothetical protein [Anaerolineaceae bacterium]
MNLDTVSAKDLQEVERLSRELLAVMRKAKLLDLPVVEMLQQLESKAGQERRERFDAADSKYNGF